MTSQTRVRQVVAAGSEESRIDFLVGFLERHDSRPTIHLVRDGSSVIAYLDRQLEVDSWMPSLLLLDAGLADPDITTVITRVRSSPRARLIPVVALVEDDRPDSVQRVYEARANSCIIKPRDARQAERLADQLVSYWLSINQFPQYASEAVDS